MVKTITHALFILTMILSMTPTAYAASFTASVDRATLPAGESVTLQLNLSGASPKGTPDFSPLDKDFTIHSTGQSSQTSIINGKISSSMNWQTILIPKKQGEVSIPALTIASDAGTLKSQPVAITVTKAGTLAQNTEGAAAVFVDTQVSKTAPYKNEPVLLSVKLITRKNINDISIPNPNIADAIIEQQGDTQVYDATLQRENVKVVEAHYLVTPLKDGTLTIPRMTFQGNIESGQQQDPFAGYFGGRAFQGFSNFPGFATYKPFAVSGEQVTLNVKPPAADITPWLPASALKISDQWDGLDSAKVGEPLTRKITITATGLSAAALPSLEDRIDPQGAFKIYADKPTTQDKVSADNTSISATRTESYTLIPQKSGTLNIPEITLSWWDVASNKIVTSTIAATTINVKPSTIQPPTPQRPIAAPPQTATSAQENKAPQSTPAPIIPKHLYILITVLGGIVLMMAGLIFYLLRKLQTQSVETAPLKSAPRPANEDKITLPVLKNAKTPNDLKLFLQSYAHQHWDMPKNATLQSIAAALKTHSPQADTSIFTTLDTALYAGGKIDMEDAKKQLPRLLKLSQKPAAKKQRTLSALNPS